MKSAEEILPTKQFRAIVVPALVVAALGVALWAYQGAAGMGVTNLSDANPWGLYLMAFMFTVGLAVGALLVAAVPQIWSGAVSEFRGLSKAATWVAVCSAVLSVGFVTVDLGGPLRVWELFVYSNFSSPLMWDIFALPLFLIVAVAYLAVLMRADAGRANAAAVKAMSLVAIIAAVALIVVDAWIFGLLPGRSLWNTALLGPWFFAAAVVSGVALAMLLASTQKARAAFGLPIDAMDKMGRVLVAAVCVDLLCLLCELITGAYGGGAHVDAVAALVSGGLAPVFWAEVIAAAIALALIAFGKGGAFSVVAACLVLLSVFCKRVQFMVSGFLDAQAPYPGIETAGLVEATPLATSLYAPSAVELGITVAVIALGIALVAIGMRALPLACAKKN